jgi:hypothetical protein
LAKSHPGDTIGLNYTGVGRAEYDAIIAEIEHIKYDGILVEHDAAGHTRSTTRTLLSPVEMAQYNKLSTSTERKEVLTVVKYVWSIILTMTSTE